MIQIRYVFHLEIPPRVEYSLRSSLGEGFFPKLVQMSDGGCK